MTTISEIAKTISEQIKYNAILNQQADKTIKETSPEILYDEITNFIGSNFGNVEMNFGRSKNPKSVSRSNNFQYFLEHNGSVTVANKFFI